MSFLRFFWILFLSLYLGAYPHPSLSPAFPFWMPLPFSLIKISVLYSTVWMCCFTWFSQLYEALPTSYRWEHRWRAWFIRDHIVVIVQNPDLSLSIEDMEPPDTQRTTTQCLVGLMSQSRNRQCRASVGALQLLAGAWPLPAHDCNIPGCGPIPGCGCLGASAGTMKEDRVWVLSHFYETSSRFWEWSLYLVTRLP